MKKTNLVLVLLLFASGSFLFAQALGPQSIAYHTVGLNSDGTVYTWGDNAYGQLGDNSTTLSRTPIKVLKGAYSGTTNLGDDSNNKITAVALGFRHSVALAADGTVYTWGYNGEGQLGNNTITDSHTPIKVLAGAYSGTYLGDDSDNKITAVALGARHSVALAADGTVYTWGYNASGQLGDNSLTQRNTPIKVLKGAYSEGTTYLGDNSGNKIIAVALGYYYSVALAADGTVYTWGYNGKGQLGNNSTTGSRIPIKVLAGAYSGTYLGDDSNNKITAVALGYYHSVALAADGTVYTWGFNDNGQLGDGTKDTDRLIPVKVLKGAYSGTTNLGDDNNNKITAVALGFHHSVALAEDGTVYTWGYNHYGQLGDDTEGTDRLIPVKVLKGAYSGTTNLGDNPSNKITAVALGAYHSIALATDGTVYTWGHNASGRLGDNSSTQRNTPIKVVGEGGTGDLALPVTLVSFTANSQNGNIALTWRTGSETENQGYLLERRLSNEDTWIKIASYLNNSALEGQGTSTETHDYCFVDNTVQSGVTYTYRLGDVDYNSNIIWHNEIAITIEAEDLEIPTKFGLQKAYPNPFNPEITLSYGLTEDAYTTLLIYDMRGQLVETLQNGNISAGNHSVIWQPMNISTGMYIVRLRSGNNTNMQKIVYVK